MGADVPEPLAAVLARLTTGQLARRVGVARSTVMRWRRGAAPRGKNRARLIALGIAPTPDAERNTTCNAAPIGDC